MPCLVPTYQLGEKGTIDIHNIYARGSLSIHGKSSQLKISSILEEDSLYLMANGTTTIQGTLYTLFEQIAPKGLQVYVTTSEISRLLHDYKDPYSQPDKNR